MFSGWPMLLSKQAALFFISWIFLKICLGGWRLFLLFCFEAVWHHSQMERESCRFGGHLCMDHWPDMCQRAFCLAVVRSVLFFAAVALGAFQSIEEFKKNSSLHSDFTIGGWMSLIYGDVKEEMSFSECLLFPSGITSVFLSSVSARCFPAMC